LRRGKGHDGRQLLEGIRPRRGGRRGSLKGRRTRYRRESGLGRKPDALQ